MGDKEQHRVYQFGDFVLDAPRRRLTRRDGTAVPLSGRVFDALVYFVEHPGEVLSRATLAKAVWPTTVVEDNNINQLISSLRKGLGDDGAEHRYVVTIAGRGYQFVEQVGALELAAATATPSGGSATSGSSHGRAATRGSSTRSAVVWGLVLASAATLAGIAMLVGVPRDEAVGSQPGSDEQPLGDTVDALSLDPSIAVLPFRNLSPREEDAYFASGLHEEVVNRLAKLRGVSVIAHRSVMEYASSDRPLPAIAQELNVGTILEGSVRYSGDQVRVSVRLADGRTGAQLWAEVYDGSLADIFAIQADIAARIGTALESELSPAEKVRIDRRPTRSVEAYARYLQAISLHRQHGAVGVSMPPSVRATLLERLGEAIALDSTFAEAHGLLAHLYLDSVLFDRIDADAWTARRAELLAAAEQAAARAVELDPALGSAHTAIARLGIYMWRLDDAKRALERAAAANPNDALVLQWSTMVSTLRGAYSEALTFGRRAIALDPRNPAIHSPLSVALLAVGDVDGAVATLKEMVDVAPTAALSYISLARMEVARGNEAAAVEALRLGEQFMTATGNLQLDAAMSYARLERHLDAERLVAAFKGGAAGRHIDPGILAWADLALGRHAEALQQLQAVSAELDSGMDVFPLLLMRVNAWADPALEQPEWVELRSRLEYRP